MPSIGRLLREAIFMFVFGVRHSELLRRLRVVNKVIRKMGAQPVPMILIDALVFAEDRRFWTHPGFDLVAILRAFIRFTVNGKRQGGSTIEQQLIRTLTGDREFSIRRKLREIYCATKAAREFPKLSIAQCYVRCAYYGWQIHGAEFASAMLGATLTHSSILHACDIIARLRYPSPFPLTDERATRARVRARHILRGITPSLATQPA